MAQDILVIAGSTRPNRRSPAIARWVADIGAKVTDAAFRVVDLKDLGLGLDDEPGIPAKDDHVQDTTRRWSEMAAAARAVVFVSPQYNWGYPAPLKNAIDHLYREWQGKPALIVTYGGHGGDKCAAQLRVVLTGIGLRLTEAMPGLILARERIVANDGGIDPDQDFKDQRGEVIAALAELAALPAS